MPTSRADALTHLCRKRLQRALDRATPAMLCCSMEQAVREIADIVSQNLPGRFERYTWYRTEKKQPTRAQYVDRVVEQWLIEAPRVHQLNAGEAAAWASLRNDLTRVAAHRLAHSTHLHSAAMTAADFADRACERLLETRYPFDIAFDAWARTILRNLILAPDRSADLLDQPHSSLDAAPPHWEERTEELHETLPDPQAELTFDEIEDRETLLGLIKQLRSPLQQAVIVLTYFEGVGDVEIARRLRKTQANVQTLRHRALARLRVVMRGSG
jgi:RNA polymerase sigma factor (sigma-70 family)